MHELVRTIEVSRSDGAFRRCGGGGRNMRIIVPIEKQEISRTCPLVARPVNPAIQCYTEAKGVAESSVNYKRGCGTAWRAVGLSKLRPLL